MALISPGEGTSGAPIIVAGSKTPSDAFANPTDALDTLSFSMVWNGTTWDRVVEATGDNLPVTGMLAAAAYLWDGANFDRMISDGTGVEAVAVRPSGSSAQAPSNATSTVYATNLVIKASAGNLYGITGYNSKTSAQFIQFHNATSLPADTAVPVVVFYVAGQSAFSLDYAEYGRRFSTGIVVCNSSTGPTKTIGAADCWFDAQFV